MVWRRQKPYGSGMKLRDSILTAMLCLGFALPAGAATVAAPLSSSSSESAGLAVQARAASAKGDTDLALRLAQAAIVADPSRPSSYDLLGDVYAADHQGDAARYYYDQALAIDPADNAAIKAIAALDRAGDTRKADASDGAKPGIP